MRVRIVAWLALLAPLGVAGACSDLDGLADADPTDASDAQDDRQGLAGDARVDTPIGDAGIPDVDPDAVVNPAAGLGVFVLQGGQAPDAAFLVAPVRVEPGDGGVRLLDCPRPNSASLVTRGKYNPEAFGPWGMRVFYEPTDPSRAKFVYPTLTEPTGGLMLVTESASCDGGGGPPRNVALGVAGVQIAPSFSDDGKRVAFLSTDSQRIVRLVTASTEGALDQFELRSVAADASTAITTAPPTWIRDTEGLKVAWVEYDLSTRNNRVRLALDKALTPDPPVLLDCGSVFYSIQQVGVFRGLGGKTFLAFTAELNDTDGGAPSERGIFAVDYKLPCASRTLLFGDVPQSYSADFILAPDGERMAHVANRALDADAGIDRNRIWIGAVSMGTREVCSNPPDGTYDIGPQWLAGGSQLVWTRRSSTTNDAVVMIADVSGNGCSNERALSAASPGAIAHTAKNGGCAVGPSAPCSAGTSGALWSLLVLVWRARARRRERR